MPQPGANTRLITSVSRPGAVTIKGNAQGRGMRIGSLRIGRFTGAVDLVNGQGTATVAMNSGNGRLFDLRARAGIASERIRIDLAGSVNQRAVLKHRDALVQALHADTAPHILKPGA